VSGKEHVKTVVGTNRLVQLEQNLLVLEKSPLRPGVVVAMEAGWLQVKGAVSNYFLEKTKNKKKNPLPQTKRTIYSLSFTEKNNPKICPIII
jgi:hypothetical protein